MDGRSGSSSMRLNFAGVAEAEIREGIRRIGRAMGGQAGLLGALTGSMGSAAGTSQAQPPEPAEPAEDPSLADVLQLPRRDDQGKAKRRRDR